MTTGQPPDTLRFLPWHHPALEPGEYTIQVEQKIAASKIQGNNHFQTPELTFSVQCERFSLPPLEVHAVFPPDASMGDHSQVLPHVVLSRSTLPWERRADAADREPSLAPWLALLVFHEGEIGQARSMSLAQASTEKADPGDASAPHFHGYAPERGQPPDDPVTVIDVKKALLNKLLPSKSELSLLTHVRIRGGTELAVVLANRLPAPGGFSTAHLVSLEEHYKDGDFEFKDVGGDEKIRLVSLLSFRFGCLDPQRSFTCLLQGLGGAVPPPPQSGTPVISTLRLPERDYPGANDLAKAQLALGAVPMRHSMREGEKTVSWYRGPLAPARNPLPPASELPVRVSDELLRYAPDTGMFDVSYAAAWELGRLLALQSKKFSIELHRWKRELARLQLQAREQKGHPLANPHAPALLEPAIPGQVGDWLKRLARLEGVPFSYLVPEERMLPRESIRIFWLDGFWVECLLDGAFSIGRATETDRTRDAGYRAKGYSKSSYGPVTGVILRSEVVSGWPGLQVDGYGRDKKLLGALPAQRLSPSVLACFFEGEIAEVRIHQKVETLHFGVDVDETAKRLAKKLRGPASGLTVTSEWKNKDTKDRIIDIGSLTSEISQKLPKEPAFTSAEFALQMIEGVEEVRFLIDAA